MAYFFRSSARALALGLVVVLAGCAVQPAPQTFRQSPNDDRAYRVMTLENGIKVLLISDTDADKAAASLSVGIGSYQNPPDREGLAHFLEHMLFLGTEKYPEAGEYQKYIDEHGGGHNAYTSLEETNYFFDVNADYLEPTLDRFAQFFIAPLFTAEYADRERNAVESEYRFRIKDDSRREWDVLREVVTPQHPLSLLGVGTKETLANTDERHVRDDLIAFYNRYYSANLMNLVVLGKEPLDELEAMVVAKFSAVRNLDIERPQAPKGLFEQGVLPKEVAVKALKDERSMSLSFPMPPVSGQWRTKPQALLSMLGDEAQNSLLDLLKQQGWVESLGAGMVFEDTSNGFFAINLNLTPEGMNHRDEIVGLTFDWIDLARERGLEQWRYDEVKKLSDLQFRFQQQSDPINWVSSLSSQMHDYPVYDVIYAGYAYEKFDRAATAKMFSYLTPDNLLLGLLAPEVEGDRESKYYFAPYTVKKLTAEQIKGWANGSALADKLVLAPRNPYLPENVELVADASAEQPLKLERSAGDVWYLPDTRFGTPKAVVKLELLGDLEPNITTSTLLSLYAAYVSEVLNPEVYPAQVAGLGFDIGAMQTGLTVGLSGFSDKQSVLLTRVLTELRNPAWREDTFEQVKQRQLRNYYNFRQNLPIAQVFNQIPALVAGSWTPLQRAAALESLTLEDLKAFNVQLFARNDYQMLVVGNHDDAQVDALTAVVDESVSTRAEIVRIVRIADLPEGEELVALPIDHEDAAVALYLQSDDDSITGAAAAGMLAEMMSAPFYTQLRTERQLGYVVGSFTIPLYRVPGLLFYVQSPVADEAALQQHFRDFFVRFDAELKAMSDEDLERVRNSLLSRLQETPQNLADLVAKFDDSLSKGYRDFDYQQQMVAAVKALTREQLSAAYQQLVLNQRQGLWAVSSDFDPEAEAEPLPDLRESGEVFLYQR